MNKFNSKINELKAKIEFNENNYYELKGIYDNLEAESTAKELEIAALQSRNMLDTKVLTDKQKVIAENLSHIESSETRVKTNNEKVIDLTNSIEALEKKYDELTLAYNQLTEELREIHQVLDGA